MKSPGAARCAAVIATIVGTTGALISDHGHLLELSIPPRWGFLVLAIIGSAAFGLATWWECREPLVRWDRYKNSRPDATYLVT